MPKIDSNALWPGPAVSGRPIMAAEAAEAAIGRKGPLDESKLDSPVSIDSGR